MLVQPFGNRAFPVAVISDEEYIKLNGVCTRQAKNFSPDSASLSAEINIHPIILFSILLRGFYDGYVWTNRHN